MKKVIIPMLAVIFSALIFSCGNSSNPTPATNNNGQFTWTIGGTTYTADSVYFNTGNNNNQINIFAQKGTTTAGYFFEINLVGTTATTYPINSTNWFFYAQATPTIAGQATAGNVVVTNITSTTASGTFSGVTVGGSTLSGSFTNIPKR